MFLNAHWQWLLFVFVNIYSLWIRVNITVWLEFLSSVNVISGFLTLSLCSHISLVICLIHWIFYQNKIIWSVSMLNIILYFLRYISFVVNVTNIYQRRGGKFEKLWIAPIKNCKIIFLWRSSSSKFLFYFLLATYIYTPGLVVVGGGPRGRPAWPLWRIWKHSYGWHAYYCNICL